ncbi:zonadhesin-like [Pararge aegeria]|uniref:zonadhesin-like n=1 Tax=Pararge aegeria TaxID=116150 RepID=UPI0019D1E8FB|nr:zonadhesin-like [Pararge aegeria]
MLTTIPTKPTLRCKKNEILKKCRTICPPQLCNISFTDFACDPIKKCEQGCDCIKNYLRDDNGICIPNNKCLSGPRPNLCPENEVWKECRTICQPQWCNISFISFAPCGENPKCEPGCDCVPNYLRDLKGICIPTEKCLSSESECGKYQEQSDCADYYSAQPQITLCRPGCRCIKGYSRNPQNECVPTQPQCGKYQEKSDCADNYSAEPQITVCRPGCRCITGYTRNKLNECEIKCGKNEEASECKQVCPPLDCRWDPTKMACKPGPCQAGCNCIKGYLTNSQGVCIPKEQCPKIPQECPENEEPTDCAKNMDPNQSTLTIKCRPCQCIENFVRNSDGVCVSKDKLCDGDRNTTYTQCPNRCTSTCKNPNGICTKLCREGYGCGCKPGYLYSDDRKCILPQDCPGGNPCKDNQTFVYCNAGCPTANCPEDDNQGEIACDQPYPCASGCACKRNYKWLNNEREKCVLASECPPVKCTRKNEIWAPCSSRCSSDKCRDRGTSICTISIGGQECQPQCVCKKGYLRNESGICVPIAECPPQCGKNEVPTECAVDYPQTLSKDDAIAERIRCLPGCKCIDGYTKVNGVCTRISLCGKNEEPNDCPIIFYPQPEPDILVVQSNEKIRCRQCRCIKGFEYSSSGVCIPISRCGKNEEANICPVILNPRAEPDILVVESTEKIRCRPCRCIKGYEYSSSGVCIPKNTLCKGDQNKTYTECPNRCQSTCKNPEAICTEKCEPKGCECKFGYIKNDDGICVLPQDCPGGNPCGYNQTYTACKFGCPTNYCPKDDSLAQVACLPAFPCSGGCACKRNYLLASEKDKRCILGSECAPFKCTRINEMYDSCPGPCLSENCGDVKVVTCNTLLPHECRPRCVCQDGYQRSLSTGECIPIRACDNNPSIDVYRL